MSWPALPAFGIIDNPIIDTPFASNDSPGDEFPYNNDFLLLNGNNFLLLNGQQLLLL